MQARGAARFRASQPRFNLVGRRAGFPDMYRDPDDLPSASERAPFDDDHEGYSGWRTDQLADTARDAALWSAPDIVLLHAGTNDYFDVRASHLHTLIVPSQQS